MWRFMRMLKASRTACYVNSLATCLHIALEPSDQGNTFTLGGVVHLDPRRVADFPVARPRKYVALLRSSKLLRRDNLDFHPFVQVGD